MLIKSFTSMSDSHWPTSMYLNLNQPWKSFQAPHHLRFLSMIVQGLKLPLIILDYPYTFSLPLNAPLDCVLFPSTASINTKTQPCKLWPNWIQKIVLIQSSLSNLPTFVSSSSFFFLLPYCGSFYPFFFYPLLFISLAYQVQLQICCKKEDTCIESCLLYSRCILDKRFVKIQLERWFQKGGMSEYRGIHPLYVSKISIVNIDACSVCVLVPWL